MKVCIDAGHGGTDPGAEGKAPYFYKEKDFNLALALLLEEELEWRDHWVVMTRRQDRYLTLPSRSSFANRLEADLFVSIHANGAQVPHIEGMEIWYYAGSSMGQEAAFTILEEMLAAFPNHRNQGIKEGNFAVLRQTRMPAVLVECEFITNPAQVLFLDNLENQLALAEAIADGIEALSW